MSINKKGSHLTLDDRIFIEGEIYKGSTKQSIALSLGKDKTTIGKEIKLHRSLTHKCTYTINCTHFSMCKDKKTFICNFNCPKYKEFTCARRDKSPGACNGCSKFSGCRYDKYRYSAKDANTEYKKFLTDSREGINTNDSNIRETAEIIKPLIDQGQSPYVIAKNHPELDMCEKTLYNYIEAGVFNSYGITTLNLKKAVRRKMPKKKRIVYKQRKDNSYLKGRKYEDYLEYIEANPDMNIVQMDTVYNDITNGPFIQTFKFMRYHFMFCIYHDQKNSSEMVKGIDLLEKILGEKLFREEVQILLTDRGTEFYAADDIEKEENGSRRTRVFYCDPMASRQKGSLENNHLLLREICPKGKDLRSMGLNGQDKLNLAVSHIASYPLENQNGKTPFEILKFYNKEMYDKLISYGLLEIEKDKVALKPYLIK